MTSRIRTAPAGSTEELQVWQAVRNQLKSLENARSASLSGYERLTRAQSESPAKSVEGIYNVVENCILDEQRCVCFLYSAISGALEQLDVLTALVQASSGNSVESRRRKRKTDELSEEVLETSNDTKGKLNSDARRTRTASSSFTRRNSEIDARYASLHAQLPLQRGRKVAFCQPQRNDGVIGDDGEVWIMATVISCINNDPNRYIVQDAEDDGASGPYVLSLTQHV